MSSALLANDETTSKMNKSTSNQDEMNHVASVVSSIEHRMPNMPSSSPPGLLEETQTYTNFLSE